MDSESSKHKIHKKKLKDQAETPVKVDDKGVLRKQKELMRIIHVKNFQLKNGNLSYLDYLELREELFRLNVLKDIFTSKAME